MPLNSSLLHQIRQHNFQIRFHQLSVPDASRVGTGAGLEKVGALALSWCRERSPCNNRIRPRWERWGRLRCPGPRHSHLALLQWPLALSWCRTVIHRILTSILTFTPRKRAISSISDSSPSSISGASHSKGSTITTK